MRFTRLRTALAVALLVASSAATGASAQHAHPTGHGSAHGATSAASARTAMPLEPGQGAFAAIAETVTLLRADAGTDWSRVDIEALREHLIDMYRVTLHAHSSTRPLPDGAAFRVTATDGAVREAIRRMLPAHVATMSGVEGMRMVTEDIADGVLLTVTGADAEMIRALGFIGLLTVGMHHQAHHLAIARGGDPHRH